MKHKILIAGNWKMNGLTTDGADLAKQIAKSINALYTYKCDFLVCPPFTLLTTVKKALRGSKIALGAQDCHFTEKGAHTGDVSPQMLKDVGCSYVIVGHSERRIDHKESSRLVRNKAKAAHEAGLKTIICVGETGEERDAGKTIEVCRRQIMASIPSSATFQNTIIAYEPVWAIGTGKTPTPTDVEEVHAQIRQAVADKMGENAASKVKILYGGSLKPSNAAEFLSLPDVNGGLIGGASLKASDFLAIAATVCPE